MTIFDKILQQEIPSYKVYEDQDTYAFLDIAQATKGHTLVISKHPGEDFLTMDPLHYQQVMNVSQTLAQDICHKLGANGCNLLTNAQPIAGQTVMKFHVHILPRYDEEDGLTIAFHPRKETTIEETHQKLI